MTHLQAQTISPSCSSDLWHHTAFTLLWSFCQAHQGSPLQHTPLWLRRTRSWQFRPRWACPLRGHIVRYGEGICCIHPTCVRGGVVIPKVLWVFWRELHHQISIALQWNGVFSSSSMHNLPQYRRNEREWRPLYSFQTQKGLITHRNGIVHAQSAKEEVA